MPGRASAKRYAQAIFDLAIEHDRLDEFGADLRTLVEALRGEEFRTFLHHAKVPLGSKTKAITEALPGVDPIVRNLLALMVSRGLSDQLSEVESGYRRLLGERRGREHVEVQSAVQLEDSEKGKISQFIKDLMNKEVVLDSKVDPNILGGLIIRVGDKLLDGSTRSKLQELGKRLRQTDAIIEV